MKSNWHYSLIQGKDTIRPNRFEYKICAMEMTFKTTKYLLDIELYLSSLNTFGNCQRPIQVSTATPVPFLEVSDVVHTYIVSWIFYYNFFRIWLFVHQTIGEPQFFLN